MNQAAQEAIESVLMGTQPGALKEAPNCPVCGATGEAFARPPLIDPQRPVEVDLLRCPSCGHGWINPMPEQKTLNELYAVGSNLVIGVGWDKEAKPTVGAAEQRVLDSLPANAGDYFELGVGKGTLYNELIRRNWKCVGVEPGAWGRFPGVISSLDDLAPDARFDVLAALDVLEHVADPEAMLRRLRQAARSNATLFCAFPNIESFRARHTKRWRMARPFGHVHYFSRDSVLRMMESAGFRMTRIKATDLWKFPARNPLRMAFFGAVEFLGLGDQWFVDAVPA